MVNVSNEFLETMEKRRDFTGYAEVTLLDGTNFILDENSFTMANNSVTDAADFNGIPLGVAVCKTVQIEIANPNDRYSDYDFYGAKILYKLRFQLSSTIESIDIGEFTVLDPQTYGETIIITALDNMYKANEYYATSLQFPATIGEMLRDICSNYDIPLATTSFNNDDFLIETRPAGNYITRNLIGYIAMIAGGNARINRKGYLEIVPYDFAINGIFVSGGNFKSWTESDILSGGTLEPWTEGEVLSGGELSERPSYHVFRKFKNLKVDTDPVVITGVQIERQLEEEPETILFGEQGYIIQVENPLVSGKEEMFLELLGGALIGGQMRRFEGDHLAYPLADFMDPCVVVDRKGNVYPTILTDIDFTFFNFTTLKNSAESPEASRLRYAPPNIDVIKMAKDLVEKEKEERELAIENLNKALSNSSGMYSSDIEQEDGSTVRYFHDKPTLGESQNVIKITSEAIGFSQDGGQTYPYGVTLDGQTITRLLYAEGINADYIITGILSDSTGSNKWDLIQGVLTATNLAVEKSIATEELVVDTISNKEYPKTLITNPVIYVNADTGNDENECVDGAVFQTLQGALNSIPRFMNGRTVSIEFQTDTVEDVTLGHIVSGKIVIYLNGKTLYGYLNSLAHAEVTVAGYGREDNTLVGTIHPATGYAASSYTASIYVHHGALLRIAKLKVFPADNAASGASNKSCVVCQYGGKVYSSDVTIVNSPYVGFLANIMGHIHSVNSNGVAGTYGFMATSGGLITLGDKKQAGGKTKNTTEGGGGTVKYHDATFDTATSSSSSTANTTKVTKTVTYTSSKGNAIQYYGGSSAKWRSDNTPKVGDWGYGDHVAFWFFGDDFENVANKNVKKIQITFTRNSGGNASAVTHHFYAHSYETQPKTTDPTYYGTRIGSASVATGDSATITITDSSLITNIKARKGICSIPPSQSSAYYSVMSGTMKVKFFYEE